MMMMIMMSPKMADEANLGPKVFPTGRAKLRGPGGGSSGNPSFAGSAFSLHIRNSLLQGLQLDGHEQGSPRR